VEEAEDVVEAFVVEEEVNLGATRVEVEVNLGTTRFEEEVNLDEVIQGEALGAAS